MTWYVVGGWALDLWHNHQTRIHEDLEFAVLAEDLPSFLSILSNLEFFSAKNGKLLHLAKTELLPNNVMQLWGADPNSRTWRVDMMIEHGTHDRWIYKRDKRISMPRVQAVYFTEKTQIPYLAPHLVLLFKAKHRREKDEFDFYKALPELSDTERKQLKVLLTASHPRHEWIGKL